MSLVTEAGYHGWPAFWAYRTLPLSAWITSSASAPARVIASAVAAQAMPTHISVRTTEDRIEDITVRDPNPWAALGNAPQGETVCLSRRRMKGKSEKPPSDALMPMATVHGKRKRPKFGSLAGAAPVLRFQHIDGKSPIGSE